MCNISWTPSNNKELNITTDHRFAMEEETDPLLGDMLHGIKVTINCHHIHLFSNYTL
jgi:hypothetical protein